MKEQCWNKCCRTVGCFGIARALSDYCKKCREKRIDRFEKRIKNKQLP